MGLIGTEVWKQICERHRKSLQPSFLQSRERQNGNNTGGGGEANIYPRLAAKGGGDKHILGWQLVVLHCSGIQPSWSHRHTNPLQQRLWLSHVNCSLLPNKEYRCDQKVLVAPAGQQTPTTPVFSMQVLIILIVSDPLQRHFLRTFQLGEWPTIYYVHQCSRDYC